MITLLDYFPNASHDSEKYIMSLSSLGITTPSLSNVYFGLLYKVLGYYYQELRISSLESDRALLTGDIPLLSVKTPPKIQEYRAKIFNPYETWSQEFGVQLFFQLLTSSPFYRTVFTGISDMTQLINWNSNNVLLYNFPNYFADWDNISGRDILTYLLHIGLVFRSSKTFSIFFNTYPINRFESGQVVVYTEYDFFVTFKLAIPEYYNQFTAQDVV